MIKLSSIPTKQLSIKQVETKMRNFSILVEKKEEELNDLKRKIERIQKRCPHTIRDVDTWHAPNTICQICNGVVTRQRQ